MLPGSEAERIRTEPAATRLRSLDGLRGCLAAYVAIYHLCENCAWAYAMQKAAQVAVLMFFVLSGWVLVRTYDGRFGAFLTRRFLRLWPPFACAMLAGAMILHLHLPLSRLFWFPIATPYAGAESDRPAWSLFIEAWAMLAMPVFVWGGRSLVRATTVGGAIVLLALAWRLDLLYGLFFLTGACLSQADWQSGLLQTRWAQWLGTISYSLYLTHWPVIQAGMLAFGAEGRLFACLAILPVAWAFWWIVERPSIAVSRIVWRRLQPAG